MQVFLYLVLQSEAQNETSIIQSPLRRKPETEDPISPITPGTNATQDDSSLQVDDSTTSTGVNSNQPARIVTMKEILSLIDNGNAESILKCRHLHYYFLKNCVINVTSKKKWRDNCSRNDYFKFVTPSDEGFALVVLDNNIDRYMDIYNNSDPNKTIFEQPKYTNVATKGVKDTVGKGWTDKGKLEFQRYTEMIIDTRRDKTWLERRAKTIKKMANRERKQNKYKRKYDDIANEPEVMSIEAKNRWNRFMLSSVNDLSEIDTMVAL